MGIKQYNPIPWDEALRRATPENREALQRFVMDFQLTEAAARCLVGDSILTRVVMPSSLDTVFVRAHRTADRGFEYWVE